VEVQMIKKGFISKTILRVFLFFYSLIVIFPLVWAVYTSFKTNKEFYKDPWALPSTLYYQNYIKAWNKAHIGNYFMNSVLLTCLVVFLLIILGSTTAYVITRFNIKAGKYINMAYMSGMLVPTILGVVPTFLVLYRLKLLDSLVGLMLVYTAYGLPFTVFVLTGFFKTLPHELEEAALIDGCSLNRTYWTIMFPLAKSGIITVSIFNFIGFWNEYVLALTYITTDKKKTLSLGLINLMETSRYETDWGALFAGLIIVMIPTLLIYAIFQGKITGGLTIGAVKG